MNPFIFYYAGSCLIAGSVCLILGLYIYLRSRQQLNRVYLFMAVMLFVQGISTALMRGADGPEQAYFWHIVAGLSWQLLFPLFLHFSLVFTGKNTRWVLLWYLPSLIMFCLFFLTPNYVLGYEKFFYGYNYLRGPWNISYVLVFLAYMTVSLFIIFISYRKTNYFYRRKQSEIIMIAISIPVIVGTLSDQILSMMGQPTLPLAIQSTAVFIWFVGFAIIRFQPIKEASLEEIADAAANTMLDPMFLIDGQDRIQFVNFAACQLTGYRDDELQGKLITEIFPGTEQDFSDVVRRNGSQGRVALETFPLAGEKGGVVLTRDLSEVDKIKRSTEGINSDLRQLIKREQDLVNWLYRFSEVNDQVTLNKLWRQLTNESPKRAEMLKPVYTVVNQYVEILDRVRQAKEKVEAKTRELGFLNEQMIGREQALRDLERELKRLQA